jgi:Bacterial protein of unknown function (DUF922)
VSIAGSTLTLSWSDFQGGVPAQPRLDAFTATSYRVNTNYTLSVRGGQQSDFRLTAVSIHVQLDRARMWSRASARSPDLLKHEQGHFDITALLMRDLDTDLTALMRQGQTYPTQPDLARAVASVQRPAESLLTRLQSTSTTDGVYDQQTRHGTIAAEQQRWDAAFASARMSPRSKLVDCLRNQGIVLQ